MAGQRNVGPLDNGWDDGWDGDKININKNSWCRHVFSSHLYTKIVILHTASCLHHAYTHRNYKKTSI